MVGSRRCVRTLDDCDVSSVSRNCSIFISVVFSAVFVSLHCSEIAAVLYMFDAVERLISSCCAHSFAAADSLAVTAIFA